MTEVAPAAVAQLPSGPGVYRFRDDGGSVLYIGRAADLRRRVRSYWAQRGDRPWLERMVPHVTRVKVAVCRSTHEAAWLERNLLERRRPRWNIFRPHQGAACVHPLLADPLAVPRARVG